MYINGKKIVYVHMHRYKFQNYVLLSKHWLIKRLLESAGGDAACFILCICWKVVQNTNVVRKVNHSSNYPESN